MAQILTPSRAYPEMHRTSLMGVAVRCRDVSCCGCSRYWSIPVLVLCTPGACYIYLLKGQLSYSSLSHTPRDTGEGRTTKRGSDLPTPEYGDTYVWVEVSAYLYYRMYAINRCSVYIPLFSVYTLREHKVYMYSMYQLVAASTTCNTNRSCPVAEMGWPVRIPRPATRDIPRG